MKNFEEFCPIKYFLSCHMRCDQTASLQVQCDQGWNRIEYIIATKEYHKYLRHPERGSFVENLLRTVLEEEARRDMLAYTRTGLI